MIRDFCLLGMHPAKLKGRQAICEACSAKLDRELRQPMREAMEMESQLLGAKP